MTTPLDSFLGQQEVEAEAMGADGPQMSRDLRRLVAGLALAASFGLALGGGAGIPAMVAQAVGVPLAFVVVALVGGPAFYVALAHAGFEVSARALGSALSHGVAGAGLVLAGLSPTMLLLAVTCESPVTVAAYGGLGLAAGGCAGLRGLFRALERSQRPRGLATRLLQLAFALFAGVMCIRIWSALPVLGGGA